MQCSNEKSKMTTCSNEMLQLLQVAKRNAAMTICSNLTFTTPVAESRAGGRKVWLEVPVE